MMCVQRWYLNNVFICFLCTLLTGIVAFSSFCTMPLNTPMVEVFDISTLPYAMGKKKLQDMGYCSIDIDMKLLVNGEEDKVTVPYIANWMLNRMFVTNGTTAYIALTIGGLLKCMEIACWLGRKVEAVTEKMKTGDIWDSENLDAIIATSVGVDTVMHTYLHHIEHVVAKEYKLHQKPSSQGFIGAGEVTSFITSIIYLSLL